MSEFLQSYGFFILVAALMLLCHLGHRGHGGGESGDSRGADGATRRDPGGHRH